MTRPRDPRQLFWGLLGLWVLMELLFSSRWWPPRPAGPTPAVVSSAAAPSGSAPLRQLLAAAAAPAAAPLPVWFAPYTTFPETGLLESLSRGGVYDTLLAIPSSGLASNYGAFKLSPADTVFSLASAQGLVGELRLAQRLGYRLLALDLGAVSDAEAAARLCRTSAGCRLSSDAYALFPLTGPGLGALQKGLARLQRRTPLLPQKSAGPSWGSVVLPQLQWGASELRGRAEGERVLVVQALPTTSMELFRYGLDRYPPSLRPLLTLGNDDVQLVLAPDVIRARLCLGPLNGPCQLLELGPGRRRLAIGDRLVAGGRSRLEIVSLLRMPNGQGTFSLELHTPAAARALLGAG